MLQAAHAGELAAFTAYDGHARSLKDMVERMDLRGIQCEEAVHIQILREYLKVLGAEPSRTRDAIFIRIGRVAGFLCRITGYFAPMLGAWVIEKIGAAGYHEMAECADALGLIDWAQEFRSMAAAEERHEAYFKAKFLK